MADPPKEGVESVQILPSKVFQSGFFGFILPAGRSPNFGRSYPQNLAAWFGLKRQASRPTAEEAIL